MTTPTADATRNGSATSDGDARHAFDDAKSVGTICICGRPVTPLPHGRPRHSCSEVCRRRRQSMTRKLCRRVEWSREWRRQAEHTECPVDEAARQVAALAAEILDLKTRLLGKVEV